MKRVLVILACCFGALVAAVIGGNYQSAKEVHTLLAMVAGALLGFAFVNALAMNR